MKGKVKFFNEQKGFGFIVGEDGLDYFVHVSDIGQETLYDDEDVEFTPSTNNRGRKATQIEK